MSDWAIRTLQGVIALALMGSALVQAGVLASLWVGTDQAPNAFVISLAAVGVLGVLTLQVTAVCIWRLLTMVADGTVFSHGAFRYVDIVIGAISAGALLIFLSAVIARFANHAVPEDEVPPGLIGLICGLAVVAGGVALLVYVMRTLLAQAVDLDSETKHLRSELDEVI